MPSSIYRITNESSPENSIIRDHGQKFPRNSFSPGALPKFSNLIHAPHTIEIDAVSMLNNRFFPPPPGGDPSIGTPAGLS